MTNAGLKIELEREIAFAEAAGDVLVWTRHVRRWLFVGFPPGAQPESIMVGRELHAKLLLDNLANNHNLGNDALLVGEELMFHGIPVKVRAS